METLVGEITALTIEQRKLTADMDAQIQAARQTFEQRLGELGKQVNEKTTVAQAWCEANPEEFGKLKSIEFLHGIVGFRTGTPKLKTLLKWTWVMVLAALKDKGWGKAYVRTKEETDKESLLAAYSQERLNGKQLRKVGVEVVQEEVFYVEPKLTEVAPTI